MAKQVIKTPYGTVVLHDEWPVEKVLALMASYAHKINYGKEKKDAA